MLEMMMSVAILYGGGQIPEANYLLGAIIGRLLDMKNIIVYGVHKSFMGLGDSSCYEKLSAKKAKEIQQEIGTYLGTCRKFDPSEKDKFEKVFKVLKKYNISHLFITGGDGSARAAKELKEKLAEAGYKIRIIFVPCTVDGINGSIPVGIKAAVEETVREIKMTTANAFATWDNKKIGPRVNVVEIQGRNRNDIAILALRKIFQDGTIGQYKIKDMNIIFIPTGYTWRISDLMLKITSSSKPTLVVVCEGAKPAERWWMKDKDSIGMKIQEAIENDGSKKSNLRAIGYLTQTNDCISKEEEEFLDVWALFAVQTLGLSDESAEAVILTEKNQLKWVPISNITDQNPNSDDPIKISQEDEEFFKDFLLS